MIKESPASKENFKADYEQYVAKATALVHSPETREKVLAMLTNNDPVQRVADASVMIAQRMDAAARAAGVEVQDTVKVFGITEIVNMVVEFGNAAKKFSLNKDLAELALSVTVQDYVKGEIKAGRIDGQKLKVGMDADIRKLPPAKRKEIQQSQARIQQIARKYNHGKGLMGGAA